MRNLKQELDSGRWAVLNPRLCPCKGSGWMLSDRDSWHRCRAHHIGQAHPESDFGDKRDFTREVKVGAFRIARDQVAKMANVSTREANEMIRKGLPKGDSSPEAWVDSACDLSDLLHEERLQARAHAHGFSCRLEAALTDAARAEHEALQCGMTHEEAELEGIRASSDWYPS